MVICIYVTDGTCRKPRRFNGSGEADLRGFSQQPGGIAVFSPIRQTPSVDTLHLATKRVFAGSVVNRSHGEKHSRTLDVVRSA